jgi:GTPase SAR1 family protein
MMKSTRRRSVSTATHAFEIRIAVLGYVSAGKTTVINALLRDKYGQVGMRRTTAGVNYFRWHHRDNRTSKAKKSSKTAKKRKVEKDEKEEGSESSEAKAKDADEDAWILDEEEEVRCVPATETLRQISEDNATLREVEAVSATHFDIYTRRPLCDVRPDTRLVLVDIPGINEAGADGKYRTYVRDKWDTFDCVLVVMDGRLGANTEEQVKLLEFVRDNNRDKRDVATIILCNKVDDPEDREQAELVKEAKEEVDKVFGGGRKKRKARGASSTKRLLLPKFIPLSAELAFIYRTAAGMNFEQFQGFDADLIDRLGRKEIGWRFSKKSPEEKFRVAFDAMTDRELFSDRIKDTNFNAVLEAIAESVGGPDVQLQLIQKQIDVALAGISPDRAGFATKYREVFDKRRALGESVDDLPAHFWKTFGESENLAFRLFAEAPASVSSLVNPLTDLVDYCTFVTAQRLEDEQLKCASRFKAFVVRQIGMVLSKESMANADWMLREAGEPVNWGTLHPIDWVHVCQSLLLMTHDKAFCESFGPEVVMLEVAKHKWIAAASDVPTKFGDCPKCRTNPLDFNNFCTPCKSFVSPIDCATFRVLLDGLSSCGNCRQRRVARTNARCSYCGSLSFAFDVSDSAKIPGLAVICHDGCSKKLNPNRFCDTCKTIYCFRESTRSRQCMLCSGQLRDGKCSSTHCGAKNLKWKELPYKSLLEVVSREYDATDGTIKPKYSESFQSVVRLGLPAHPSDPTHFGHVAWKYCHFVESLASVNN